MASADPSIMQGIREECEHQHAISPIDRVLLFSGLSDPCEQTLAGQEGIAAWVANHLSVHVVPHSRVITIGYRSVIPAVATKVVNSLAATYLKDKQDEISESRARAVEWLRKELAYRGEQLASSELEIVAYRRKNNLVRGQQAPILSEELSSLSQRATDVALKKAAAAAALAQLGPEPFNISRALESAPALESRTISELRLLQATLAAKITHLATTYGEQNPVLVPLRNEQAAIGRQIEQEVRRIAAGVRQQFEQASQEASTLDRQIASVESQVGEAGTSEAVIAGKVQALRVQQEMYLDIARKIDELETERRVRKANAGLVTYAGVPTRASFPKPAIFTGIGLVLSLGVGSACALFWDLRDRSARRSDAVEAVSGLPVISRVPYARGTSGHLLQIVGYRDQPSQLQEAIRGLYGNLFILPPGRAVPHTVLVTSAERSEGKTLITLALAVLGAKAGKRVLVIESDLRQPTFSKFLGIGSSCNGLADLLRGSAGLDDAVQRDNTYGFDFIPAGRPVLHSTELLGSERLLSLLQDARRRYDHVLVDSPPASFLMDAHILAARMDMVLFCARWGRSSLQVVADGIRTLQHSGATLTGIVLNCVRIQAVRHYEPALRNTFEAYITHEQ